MPALADHRAAAKRFRALYDAIPPEHVEGRVLALFYSALHLVEAVAASEGKHNRDHSRREVFLKRDHVAMWKHYRPLHEASEKVRYLAGGQIGMTAEQVEHQLRRKNLRAFELWSAKVLGDEPELQTLEKKLPPAALPISSSD